MKIHLTKTEMKTLVAEGTYHAAVAAELDRRGLRIASYASLEATNTIDRMRAKGRTPAEACNALQSADLTYSPAYYPNGL